MSLRHSLLALLVIAVTTSGVALRATSATVSTQPASQPSSDVFSSAVARYQDYLDKHKGDSADALQPFQDWLSMYKEAEAIKTGQEKPALVIPFDKLGGSWQKWKANFPYRSIFTIVHTATTDNWTVSNAPVRYDENGAMTLPTDEGSFFVFKSDVENPTWAQAAKQLNGIIVESTTIEPIYFVVMDNIELVHLKGRCTVVLPDGTKVEAK